MKVYKSVGNITHLSHNTGHYVNGGTRFNFVYGCLFKIYNHEYELKIFYIISEFTLENAGWFSSIYAKFGINLKTENAFIFIVAGVYYHTTSVLL